MTPFLEPNDKALDWTPFLPFSADLSVRRQFPIGPGLYRVKIAGRNELAYIGQTGRNLRERLSDLIRNTLADEMPFNDPHTAAPRLWSYRDADGMQFEVSAATVELSTRDRMAVECHLIWQYRQSAGTSPLCNFGRLHPQYVASKNRSTGQRGGRSTDKAANTCEAASLSPLQLAGTTNAADWMGLPWSRECILSSTAVATVPSATGVYRLTLASDILYIGEAIDIATRLRGHCSADRSLAGVKFSFVELPTAQMKHQRLEIENDLIGGYYQQMNRAPEWQFGHGSD